MDDGLPSERRRGRRERHNMNFSFPSPYGDGEYRNIHGHSWPQSSRSRRQPSLLLIAATAVSLSLMGMLAYLLLRSPSKLLQQPSDIFEQFIDHSPECAVAPEVPGDRRKDKSLLRVVNFNAEWLFLYGGRGSIRCPSESCPWATTLEALEHFRRVAALLASLDADIIHLDEVEDCRALHVLLSFFPLNHGYKPYVVAGRDHITGQNVALLTRIDPVSNMVRTEKRASYPIPESTCRKRRSGTIGITKHYVVPLDVVDGAGGRTPLLLAGLHLLARPSDAWRCGQREGQAAVLRDMIRSMAADTNRTILIMGDFNDYDEDAPGPDGNRPISNVLSVLYQSSGSDRKLTNAASLIPQKERYSCWFDVNQNCRVDGDRERVMIDHILFDTYLKEAIVEARIIHDRMPTCSDRPSDHWPVLLVFNLTKLVRG